MSQVLYNPNQNHLDSPRHFSAPPSRKTIGSAAEFYTHMSEIQIGKTPMLHPGAPRFRPGKPYILNEQETRFAEKAKRRIFWRAAVVSCIGFMLPWTLTMRKLGPQAFNEMMMTQSLFKLPVFRYSMLGGFAGIYIGEKINRPIVLKDGLKLEDSAFAKEARYVIFGANNRHPLLAEVQHLCDEFREDQDRAIKGLPPLSTVKSSPPDPQNQDPQARIRELAKKSQEKEIMDQKRRRFYAGRGLYQHENPSDVAVDTSSNNKGYDDLFDNDRGRDWASAPTPASTLPAFVTSTSQRPLGNMSWT